KLRGVLKNVDRLVCLTEEIEKEVRGAGALPDRLVRIPNGIDARRFRPAVSEEEKKTLRAALKLPAGRWIVFSGRLTPQKRPQILLETFFQCAAALPDVNLLFLGDGPLRDELEKKVRDGNWAHRVFLRGNQKDMEAYYRSA